MEPKKKNAVFSFLDNCRSKTVYLFQVIDMTIDRKLYTIEKALSSRKSMVSVL